MCYLLKLQLDGIERRYTDLNGCRREVDREKKNHFIPALFLFRLLSLHIFQITYSVVEMAYLFPLANVDFVKIIGYRFCAADAHTQSLIKWIATVYYCIVPGPWAIKSRHNYSLLFLFIFFSFRFVFFF